MIVVGDKSNFSKVFSILFVAMLCLLCDDDEDDDSSSVS